MFFCFQGRNGPDQRTVWVRLQGCWHVWRWRAFQFRSIRQPADESGDYVMSGDMTSQHYDVVTSFYLYGTFTSTRWQFFCLFERDVCTVNALSTRWNCTRIARYTLLTAARNICFHLQCFRAQVHQVCFLRPRVCYRPQRVVSTCMLAMNVGRIANLIAKTCAVRCVLWRRRSCSVAAAAFESCRLLEWQKSVCEFHMQRFIFFGAIFVQSYMHNV